MTAPPAPVPAPARPPWSWIVAMAGFVVVTVTVIGIVVQLVLDAVDLKRSSEAKGGFARDGFLDGLSGALSVLAAVVVAVFAAVWLLVLFLSARPGGRREAGLITGIVLLAPITIGVYGGYDDGVSLAEVGAAVGVVLVLVGVVVPATWRWVRRPKPHPAWQPPP